MDERRMRDEDLKEVSGGVGEMSFARLAEDFALTNRCSACPGGRPKLYYHGMCPEEYNRLLLEWSKGGSVNTRCTRRR